MTDLVRYQPPSSSLDLAPQAWKLAEKIAGTDFVPTALRGRPEAVLACILAGHEVGISPMQALAKIHIIEGRPAMAAEMMRALVFQHGHELNYDEVSTTSVTASGRRHGSDRWTKVTWTMDDAKRGGLDGKQNWRKWPRAMLIARATAELCRMVFPDVLAGISYTVEELSDGAVSGDLVDFGPPELVASTPAAPARQTAKAPRAVTRGQQPADEIDVIDPPAAGEIPDLPELPDDVAGEILEAELVKEAEPVAERPSSPIETTAAEAEEWPSEEWPSGDFPSDEPVEAGRRYSGPQLVAIKLAERFGIKGNSTEARAQRIAAIVQILGREITSSKDLTPGEIGTVIERLDAWPADRPLFPSQAPEEAQAPAVADEAPIAPEIAQEAPPVTKPAETPRRTTPAPDTWTGDQWRELISDRKVKATETMREAQRLGALCSPPASIGTLDDIAGSGIAGDLLGFVEDLSLDRRK